MRRAAMGRQFCLELGNFGSHDVLSMIENPRDSRIHPVADAGLLGGEIDKTNGFRLLDGMGRLSLGLAARDGLVSQWHWRRISAGRN
jgi:hypothetical protein